MTEFVITAGNWRIFAVEQLVTPFIADALGRNSLCSLRGTQKKMSQHWKN